MKKNKQGFTLVELLAAIVILGVLMAAALPTIVGMMDSSRDKLYIDAATKLIAQAEYKMRSSANEIEKPEIGNAIVISLVYLDSSDFDNPPGNGKYLKEASFVVVKNTNSGLEYSATIVEKVKKGGYKGVKLAKDSDLAKRNARRYIYSPKEEDIICVELGKTEECKSSLSVTDFIKGQFGNSYIGDVDYIYNYPSLAENTTSSRDKAPSVVGLIASASNKSYRSYDALLTVKAEDVESLVENLKLYLAYECGGKTVVQTRNGLSKLKDEESTGDGFKDAYSKGPITFSDGSTAQYQIKLDFASMFELSGYNGEEIKIYISVEDEAGNRTEKEIGYEIHRNRPPVIDTSESKTFVKKRNFDEVAMPMALLGLSVSDDVDSTSNLEVCIAAKVRGKSGDLNTCTNYKKYNDSSLFGNSGTVEYNFGTPALGGNYLDGRTIDIKIYVKDSAGAEATTYLFYTVHENAPPTINNLKVTSKTTEFTSATSGKGGSLSTVLSFVATDDMDIRNLDVSISGGENIIAGKYATNGVYTIDYDLGGTYDGGTRKVTVKVTDAYGQVAESSINYTVYKNEKPSISSVNIISKGNPCSNVAFCSDDDDGGSLDTKVSITATDDMDKDETLKACVSEKESDCTANKPGNFDDYSKFKNKDFTLTPNDREKPYDGSTRKIYFAVMDSSGGIETSEAEYKLYENKGPNIDKDLDLKSIVLRKFSYNLFTDDFTDELNKMNLNKAILDFTASDDEEDSNLTFKVCRKLNTSTVEGEALAGGAEPPEICSDYTSYYDYINSKGDSTESEDDDTDSDDDGTDSEDDSNDNEGAYIIDFEDERYFGQTYDVTVVVKDSYGKETRKTASYKFYKDQRAIIDNFSVVSSEEKEEEPDDNFVNEQEDVSTENSDTPVIQDDSEDPETPIALPPEEPVFQSKNIRFKFHVRDPFDKMNVCIGTSNKYSECVTDAHRIFSAEYEDPNGYVEIDGTHDVYWDYDDKEASRTIYLVVRDSYGNETTANTTYSIYKRCSEMLYDVEAGKTFDYWYEYADTEKPPISATTCGGKCYVPIGQEITIYAKYNYIVNYFDKYLDADKSTKECYKTSEIDIDCSYYMCFQDESDSSKFYKAIGTKKVSVTPWSHVVQEEEKEIQKIWVEETVEETIDGVTQQVIHEVEKEVEVVVKERIEHFHDYGYLVYTTKLDGDTMVLTTTTEYVCPDAYESGDYYVPKNGYVIIDDSPYEESGDGTSG